MVTDEPPMKGRHFVRKSFWTVFERAKSGTCDIVVRLHRRSLRQVPERGTSW
jgi:hypothetical protein